MQHRTHRATANSGSFGPGKAPLFLMPQVSGLGQLPLPLPLQRSSHRCTPGDGDAAQADVLLCHGCATAVS
ncbi:hypothetical protein GCM10010307_27770 [Streptomyces vastus]|uniref:Uncharacterized protein n=1 Tax=Streptomyces vastus TaxID=285451 RepID=A0ABN3QRI2_9ACTN